jgi:FkbM family methyltransferase
MKSLKLFLNQALRTLNYQISKVKSQDIRGFKLENDLAILIPQSGATVLDIGANRGQTIELLSDCLDRPKIHAFEPSKNNYSRLSSVSWRPEISLYQLAMGRSPGEIELINYSDPCLTSIREMDRSGENRFRETKEISREKVRLSSVDAFVDENKIRRIDLLKIDTQGYDLDVLEGANRTLSEGRVGNVLVELNFVAMYEEQSNALDIFSMLRNHGFELVDFYEKIRQDPASWIAWCTALFTKHRY